MNGRTAAVGLCALALTAGSCTLVENVIIPVNLQPVAVCYRVGPNTSGTWSETSDPIDIASKIDDAYRAKVKQIRLYDAIVRVTGAYPQGRVRGTVFYALDLGAEDTLFQFDGQYAQFAQGVSLVNPGGLITYSPQSLEDFLQAFNSPTGLPQTIVLRSLGTTATPVDEGVAVNVELLLQGLAEAL